MIRNVYIKHKIANLIHISKIVTIHYFEFDKNFKFEGESHDFWEMVYIDKGEALISAKNKIHKLKQGEAIFHKPNEFHSINADDIVAPNIFIITFVSKSKAMEYFKKRIVKIPSKLKKLISEIIEEGKQSFDLPFNNTGLTELKLLDTPILGGQQLIRIYLEELLIKLIRLDSNKKNETKFFHTKESLDNILVSSINEFLISNLYNQITFNEICSNFNYSKSHLCDIFKKNMDYSIMEYLSFLRISEAKKLIREQNYNMTEISNLLYFDNPHYFSRAFKRFTGMTPREYKYSVKNN